MGGREFVQADVPEVRFDLAAHPRSVPFGLGGFTHRVGVWQPPLFEVAPKRPAAGKWCGALFPPPRRTSLERTEPGARCPGRSGSAAGACPRPRSQLPPAAAKSQGCACHSRSHDLRLDLDQMPEETANKQVNYGVWMSWRKTLGGLPGSQETTEVQLRQYATRQECREITGGVGSSRPKPRPRQQPRCSHAHEFA